jgi:DNA replication protein DnaC
MSKTVNKPQVLLEHHLKALKLPTFLAEYEKVARESAADGVDHPRYLLRLAELELIERERRLVDRRIRAAKFPAVKSLDTFDFMAIPALNKMLVLELARSEYVIRYDNVIALGPSGTGKTHVALGLGLAACQKGFSVLFTSTASLVNRLMEWTSPDLVESHSLFPAVGPVCCLERCRADVAEARMPSARVIEPFDVLANRFAGFVA